MARDAFSVSSDGLGWGTYPTGENCSRTIDHVFLSDGLTVERAWVHRDHPEASDHYPVLVDIRLD